MPTVSFASNALAIVTGFASLLFLAWVGSVVLTAYGLYRQKHLSRLNDSRLTASDVPLVSVLVPARNEEHRVLADCIRSILAQDYGSFEVIAINDRSTDATGTILESFAKCDPRLRVITGEDLPAGWLGKPYAMQQALAPARGEWILATDADMIFDKAALRTAVDRILTEKGDAMTLIPRFEAGSFWERVMIPTWGWVLLIFSLAYRISSPKTHGAVGMGGFFLMRRTVLERVGGYEALRDEVMEDVRLAEMIKRSGARLLTEYAPDLLSTRMYRNFGEMWECSTKNWFSGVKFSLPFALVCVCSMYLMALVPPLIALASAIGITAGASPDLRLLIIPAALSWLLQVIVLAMSSIRSEVSPAYALTAPLGLSLLYAMLFDSSIRITTGKGVTWKGRRIYERSGVRPPRLRTRA
ncbi:MAG TPA: glycosyltransferase family 2 protein [Pyrinomonadaceae bacterium]|nr:glycosyltransferase family 2 protein [Pyrinomonadaceae bacterium]